ncbi:PepSY domain-containing protein [Psychrobium sp. 1_MG-2023]|uniref:PepSY-associated TM helix domain-containing protein n=1 Tax=Psychrobium sp. 1_MG-2023 TaxID=3062624 RepID=UPI00269978FB|nr:PepSY-associated TM helix domain-containing protein [Psychrobium sp. 1_MG-2023]MDP2560644.1 PepSY-associated TM helix domain-containing protein [Psychrobium sp. 1_MG-2023]
MLSKQLIKNLTEAHSWIGLIISSLLFIVFFAGSIALFRSEINLWSMQPHFDVHHKDQQQVSVDTILDNALAGRDYDGKEHITLVMPQPHSPFYRAYIDIKDRPQEPHYDSLLLDPVTGKVISEGDKFQLANFIYQLHYDLNLPWGLYIVGFITLFFFFALISGIFIHARKFIANFFQYRNGEHKRTQLLDMHNVVGVISIPFTVMYAITGLIFNLVIIYQIAFALLLYKGDQDALLNDAGIVQIAPEWQDKPVSRANLAQLVSNLETKYQLQPERIRFYNYGDASGVIEVRANSEKEFGYQYTTTHSFADGHTLTVHDDSNPNTLVLGLDTLKKLHYANFANVDLRVIYFILGLAVCALIVTGNLLWIEKQQKRRHHSARAISMARYVTNVGSVGIVVATSVAFMSERLVPINIVERMDIIILCFYLGLLVSAVAFLLPKNQEKSRQLIAIQLNLSAVVLISTVILDWVLFQNKIVALSQAGYQQTIGVEIGLLLSAVVLALTARRFQAPKPFVEQTSEAASTAQSLTRG